MGRPTGRSSDRPRPTPTSAESIALSGPSELPDPAFHAYRRDLADRALAGRVIASHYVEPVELVLVRSAAFRSEPRAEAAVLSDLVAGDVFRMLEHKLGWAWGYAGAEERVGYLPSDALGI